MKTPLVVFLQLLLTAWVGAASAQRYTLVNGSDFLNDCPICGRPSIIEPMRGTFDLIATLDTATKRSWTLTNIAFVTRADTPRTITGYGTFELTFGTRTNQLLTLYARVDGVDKVFTNDMFDVTRLWPMISTHLVQTQVNLFSFDSMNIVAAPVRELWFVTTQDFFATNLNRTIVAGDLLAMKGRLVKQRSELLAAMGISTPAALDAETIAPGSDILFSLRNDTASSNGVVHHGDVLSARGTVAISNATLTAGFDPQPANTDLGLDALYVADDGQVYFSTAMDFIAPAIGVIGHGDVLAYNPNAGGVSNRLVKTRQQLLAGFSPANPAFDPGLDALFVWPSGEIWFSTEQNWDSQQYGPINHGDLLSDAGQIIFRAEELTAAYDSVATNRGLTSVFVVSDFRSTNAAGSRIANIRADRVSRDVTLTWGGSNRVHQIERATIVTGPYAPVSEIIPAWSWVDPGRAGSAPQSFYRLKSW